MSAEFTLSLDSHLYLKDHAIGGAVQESGGTDRVFLLPLMVALEMMAETASLLAPGMVPVELSAVRAHRRIRVTASGFPLRITANQLSGETIEVALCDAGDTKGTPLMSSTVRFAREYPQPPPDAMSSVAGGREPRIEPARLYAPGHMFHGPRMQAVEGLDKVGDREIAGSIAIRPISGWFADPGQAHEALIDPLALDNASQLVLYHLFEHEVPVSALLPFYIERIEFFSAHAGYGTSARVWAQLTQMNEKGTTANVAVADSEGRLWARIQGISSRKIALAPRCADLVASPKTAFLSDDMTELARLTGQPDSWCCTSVRKSALPGDAVACDWLTDYLLSPAEIASWSAGTKTEKRKLEWLLGRIAAKDAVRKLVERETGKRLAPADVEIGKDERGCPQVCGTWLGELGWTPSVSIAHTDGIAIALAGHPRGGQSAGVDIEPIVNREPNFNDLAFTQGERERLSALPQERQTELSTRIWCAKEAVGKALGNGLAGAPGNLEAIEVDDASGLVTVAVGPSKGLEGRFRAAVVAYTLVRDDTVMAVSAGNPAPQP